MSRQITKELALKIVDKLSATPEKAASKSHDAYGVYLDGRLIVLLSIRRASERDKGHDHIPGDMHVGPNFAKEFAICNRSVAQWHEKLREKGII